MCIRKPCFRLEIDNFSEKEEYIESPTFESGGCEWYLSLYPKGDHCDDHLSLYLNVANTQLLQSGWKRRISYYFIVMNQRHKELYRSSRLGGHPFCAENPSWGKQKFLPLKKIQEKGFLEKDRLIIQVYIDILEATDGKDLDVSRIQQRLQDLESGFVKNCLELKSKEISLKKKEADADVSLVKKLEERVIKLELMNLDLKLKLEEVSLERKKSDDVNGSRIQQQEERIKSLEMMMSDLKVGLDKEMANSCADGFFLVDDNDVLM
ncbi:unnamed protein product [Eruca vesicaria subsp. sativa]|uniref:MATH domain-containing protein n=1 Tax=Eruca vesicaria subsp. sativa TaxID=29727 RepID=A0ABC8LHR5_ERUVS|nr:unnamed protein product [Eruca vesicaria subsp. sativa]